MIGLPKSSTPSNGEASPCWLVSHNPVDIRLHPERRSTAYAEQHEVRAARFYPIVVEDCDWEAVEWLKQFNLRPRDGRPVGINIKASARKSRSIVISRRLPKRLA